MLGTIRAHLIMDNHSGDDMAASKGIAAACTAGLIILVFLFCVLS